MNNFKKMFAEFKSIFISENIIKENEEHANIVTASTMLHIFWICIITWILTYFNIFKIGVKTMNAVLARSVFLLVIPSIICYICKGRGKWVKHLLFICFTIMIASADAMLKYNVTIIMVLPLILAARYYNKYFTISVAIATTFAFAISTFLSVRIGQQDLNTYNLVIPEGTIITINSTLREALTQVNIDESQRLKNIFIHFFLPKMLIFNILSFACVQVSQSGKNMIKTQEEITKKNARIDTELNLANAIQKGMLQLTFPPFPDHKEFDIYASMIPAKEVGGDFYDMFLVDENHLAILIADVSGKGIPASLVMMITKILIKNVTLFDIDVDKALTRVNKMLCDGNKINLFITCWFGILDLKSGKIEFVNAGHNPPLLYSKKTGRFEFLKTKANLVLAGFESTNYIKNEIQIEPGDRIFLYTDGVTEATNDDNKLYGEERLQNFLNTNLNLNVEDTIKSIKKDIDKFVGSSEQFDDITMLELIYNGRNKNNISIKEKEFIADTKELYKVQEFVESELINFKFDSKKIMQINLAVEEIFVNIAKYAYKEKNGICKLIIKYDKNIKIDFIFEDTGIPFNPLEKEEPNINESAENRKIGGLGIYITKNTMDDVKYKYENNKNILTLTKNI